MKKVEIEKLDELNKKKQLNKKDKNKILNKVLSDFLIAIDILLLFIILMFIKRYLDKNIAVCIYKISSVIFLMFTLVTFEIAYKKDNDTLGITGIEMLFVSICLLLLPYFFIERPNLITLNLGSYFACYYIFKNLIVYNKMKKDAIMNQSDIPEIIKKESQDKMAKEELEKRIKEQEQKEEAPKRKRGRPRKIKTDDK